MRIQARLAQAYPGFARRARQLSAAWLALPGRAAQPSFAGVCDTLLALALAAPEDRSLPDWLPRETAGEVLARLAALEQPGATAASSFELTVKLGRLLAAPGIAAC